MMTDRPIIFSGPMVRALLNGTKTQTRRMLAIQPELFEIEDTGKLCEVGVMQVEGDTFNRVWLGSKWAGVLTAQKVNYAVGDCLWVKETHAYVGAVDPAWLLFRANGYEEECRRHGFDEPFPPESAVKWTSSIFMRRDASRLTLKITDVRIERLQDISEADAIAEGVVPAFEGFALTKAGECWGPTAKKSYAVLWDSINGKTKGAAWDDNPWIVAISFKVAQ